MATAIAIFRNRKATATATWAATSTAIETE
jgi:hypothetical protein